MYYHWNHNEIKCQIMNINTNQKTEVMKQFENKVLILWVLKEKKPPNNKLGAPSAKKSLMKNH